MFTCMGIHGNVCKQCASVERSCDVHVIYMLVLYTWLAWLINGAGSACCMRDAAPCKGTGALLREKPAPAPMRAIRGGSVLVAILCKVTDRPALWTPTLAR